MQMELFALAGGTRMCHSWKAARDTRLNRAKSGKVMATEKERERQKEKQLNKPQQGEEEEKEGGVSWFNPWTDFVRASI